MTENTLSEPSFKKNARNGIGVFDLIYAFWRGKWLILFLTFGSVFMGGYYAFVVVTPIYESSSVVILEPDRQQIAAFQNTITEDTQKANSEVEILRSRSLMHDVVAHLGLMNDPEFNRTLTPPSRKVVIKSQIKKELGWVSSPSVLSKNDSDQRTKDTVVSQLLKMVRIENLHKSNVFRITVRTKDAAKSAHIADAIAQLYIQNQMVQKRDAVAKVTAWLDKRVGELQIDLEQVETKISDFKAARALVSATNLQLKKRQLKNTRERIAEAYQAKDSIGRILEKMRNASDNATKIALTGDEMLVRLGQDNQQQADFDIRFEDLFIMKAAELRQIEEHLIDIQSSVVELSAQITQQEQDSIKLQQLNREAQIMRVLYEHFLSRLKENASQQEIQRSDSRILSSAVIPFEPAEPRKYLIVSMSALFGVSLSVFLVLSWELRRSTFLSLRALERHSGLQALAHIPEIEDKDRYDFLDDLNQNPQNQFSNAIRAVRTSLMMNPESALPKVVAITSCLFEHSTATVSVSLARDFARLGNRVLLIDADLKTSGLKSYFGDQPTRGIVSVLREEHEVDQSVHHPGPLGADILFAEDPTVIASDLILPHTFGIFIEEMKQDYDLIVINTPSVISEPSTRIISRYANAVVLVAKWGSTTKSQMNTTFGMLEHAAVPLAGVVLSDVKNSFTFRSKELFK